MQTENSYFDEKAQQVSVHSLTAFGISITSRYAKARELAELLAFAEHSARFGVHKLVKEAFYDSKACLCTFEFTSEIGEYSTEAMLILEAARETVGQFDWFGYIEHGGPSRDLDQDS